MLGKRYSQYLTPISNRFKEAITNIYQDIFSNLRKLATPSLCSPHKSTASMLFHWCLDSSITIFENYILFCFYKKHFLYWLNAVTICSSGLLIFTWCYIPNHNFGSSPLTTRAAVFYAVQTLGPDLSCFQDVCGVIGMVIITANDKMCKMVPPFLMT